MICDEISNLIGAKPKYLETLFKDPRLFLFLLFGPVTPPQYRLYGPHKWHGARDSILNCWKNTKYPTQTRKLTPKPYFVFLSHLGLFTLFLFIGIFITYLLFIYLR